MAGAAALLLIAALAVPAWAGGGPESVAIVANPRSWASLTVANHYASLRQIPEANILYIDWPYPTDKIDAETFRQALLSPAFGVLRQRGILDQIDYVIYSSDFPWSIDFARDLGSTKLPEQMKPVGSLTSMTYAANQLLQKDYHFIGLGGNNYMRRAAADAADVASRGFRSWYGFNSEGKLIEGGGERYVLSTMLGITSGYGNSVDEVLYYLRRSTLADGTKPTGTIYFCQTGDPHRSGPREKGFPAAVAALAKLGVKAQIVTGKLPAGKSDVQGLMTGTRDFDWKSSKSTILPGAICENFTSYGGIFTVIDQTRLSEFLKYGAAGASGTVIEPYSIAYKFPAPFIQVHYARGCTLAESFYQSVSCPYQLLVVGDPLCRPWANIPRVSVDSLSADSTVSGIVSITPHGAVENGVVDRFELYVEGARVGTCAAGGSLQFDTTKLPDGPVEVRVVGIESSAIETQGRLILPLKVDNGGRAVALQAFPSPNVKWRQPLKLTAGLDGAAKIFCYAESRVVGAIDGAQGEVDVKPEQLGLGPVTFRAKAIDAQGKPIGLSAPIEMTIEPNAPLPGRKTRQGTKLALKDGLQLSTEGAATKVIPGTNEYKWFVDAGVPKDQPFTLVSIFQVPADNVYQFEVKHVGKLSIKVDTVTIYESDQKEPFWRYAPVALGAGMHQFEMNGKGGQPAGLEIRFGPPGATNLSEKQFQHP